MTEVATIVEIRRLKEQGLSKRAVARRLGISRETVRKYWEGGICFEQSRYSQRVLLIDPFVKYITERLEKYPELSADRIFKEIGKKGFTGSERTVRRYLQEVRPRSFREYKPVNTLPGEQAQVDWGSFGTIVIDGTRYKLYAFVFTLAWSRVSYVEFVISMDTVTFLSCLHRAFEYIGGIPIEVLFDNAKTAVSERVGKIVRFNKDLLQMAITYNFTPRACWVSDPESKGKVESKVKYVRSGFFYGLEYDGFEDLKQKAFDWCHNQANQRVHGTTGLVPLEQLEEEKLYFKPLPTVSALPYVVEERKVTRDSLISVAGNRYSVPARWARQKICYRRYERHLELLVGGSGEVIPLVVGKGKRVVKDEHYPEHQRAQARSAPSNPLQAKFESLAPQAADYLQGLSVSGVGTLRNQMEQIVDLKDAHSPEAFSWAMQRALDYGAFGYGTLKRILQHHEKSPQSLPSVPGTPVPLDASLNVQVEKRDLAYYQSAGGR